MWRIQYGGGNSFLRQEGCLQDLLARLLERKPARRLGMLNGLANDVKNHPWFSGIDWIALSARKVETPRQPKDDSAKRLRELQVSTFAWVPYF